MAAGPESQCARFMTAGAFICSKQRTERDERVSLPPKVKDAISTFESAVTSATELFVVPKSIPATLNGSLHRMDCLGAGPTQTARPTEPRRLVVRNRIGL